MDPKEAKEDEGTSTLRDEMATRFKGSEIGEAKEAKIDGVKKARIDEAMERVGHHSSKKESVMACVVLHVEWLPWTWLL